MINKRAGLAIVLFFVLLAILAFFVLNHTTESGLSIGKKIIENGQKRKKLCAKL